MRFRLAQVLPQSFLVWRLGGDRDVDLQGGLELALFAEGLAQVLDELRVALIGQA